MGVVNVPPSGDQTSYMDGQWKRAITEIRFRGWNSYALNAVKGGYFSSNLGFMPAGCVGACAGGDTFSVSADKLYAVPFIAPARNARIGNIAYSITTDAVGNARMGIYANSSASDEIPVPGSLVYDSGDVSTVGTGNRITAVDLPFGQGALFWLALSSSAAIVIRGMPISSFFPIFGGGPGGPDCIGISVPRTHAALPSTFTTFTPGTHVISGSTGPRLSVQFSA